MKIGETAAILAKAQLVDNRQISELVIREWHQAIGHLDYEDATAAVTHHRRTSTEYLQPAHVVAGARRAREARERTTRPAITAGNQITMPTRAEFDAMTQRAIEEHRQRKGT